MTGASEDRDRLRLACGMTVRSLREQAGWSQEALAHEAGVDRSYMSSLERGLHTPNLETVYKLLPVLNVTFSEFAAELEHALRFRVQPMRGKRQA